MLTLQRIGTFSISSAASKRGSVCNCVSKGASRLSVVNPGRVFFSSNGVPKRRDVQLVQQLLAEIRQDIQWLATGRKCSILGELAQEVYFNISSLNIMDGSLRRVRNIFSP